MSPGVFLDTDWVIDHFSGIAAITRRIEQLRPSGLALSVISLAELSEEVHYSRDPAKSRAALVRFVSAVTVLPIDEEVCDIFGRERGRLRQRGTMIGDFDLPSPRPACATTSRSARTTVATSRWWRGSASSASRKVDRPREKLHELHPAVAARDGLLREADPRDDATCARSGRHLILM